MNKISGHFFHILPLAIYLLLLSAGILDAKDLTEEQIRNMTFKFSTEDEIEFTNGKSKYNGDVKTPPGSYRIEKIALGRLNKDGSAEAAVILLNQSRGSGEFHELTALINNRDGTTVQTRPIELGRRIIIKSMIVKNRVIIIGMLTHASKDALCCPTKHVTKKFKIKDNQIVDIILIE
jgi:hypothetical protein